MTDNVYATNPSTVQSEKAAVASVMHEQLFADPSAFLEAFRADYLKFGASNSGTLQKQQLEQYANIGSDQDARAVARTALNHFDAIKDFRNNMLPHSVEGEKSDGLTITDLQLVDDAIKGNAKPYVDRRVAHDNYEFKWDGGGSSENTT